MENIFNIARVDHNFESDPMTTELELLRNVPGVQLHRLDCENEDQVIEMAQDIDVIVTHFTSITDKILSSLPRLKAVIRYGVGYDVVDMKAASRNGIYVVNVPDFCGEEVSNHVIMFILAYAKKLTTMDNLLKNGRWQQAKMVTEPMRSIHGETLGIIGCGNLGRWVAQKAKAFNMRIVGYDKYTQRDVIEKAGIEFVSLDELLQMSDYITLNVTYTEETHHMINKAALAKMKSNCVLINCSRGSVVDEVALIEALRSGVIEGACLDVFESEPIESHNPLLKMERVLLTPHNASYSDVSFVRLKQSVIQEALRIKDGLLPKNLVNKSLGKPND